MSRAGKNEQNANYYLIAANGVMKEYKMEEESVQEESDITDTSVARTRGGSKGIVKLINIQRHLGHLEREYKKIQNNITAEKLKTEKLFVSNNLQSSDVIKKDSDGISVEKMINTFEQIKTNSKIRQHRPGYVLPLFNGYILYSKLINTKHLRQGGAKIKFEFDARGIINQVEPIVQSKVAVVTKLAKAMKQNEKIRFEKDLDEDLMRRSVFR